MREGKRRKENLKRSKEGGKVQRKGRREQEEGTYGYNKERV